MLKTSQKWKFIFIIFLLFTTHNILFSQEGLPVYSDYLTDNYYLIHPSMAGISSCSQIRLTARRSWLGQNDAPGLQTLSYNGRINRSSAIGFNAFNDKNGFHSQSGGYGTYAHHILFSRDEVNLNMLSFGLSAGLIQYRLDRSNFVVGNDQIVGNSQLNSTHFNMDFGFSYHLNDYYTHFTAKNLLENQGINNEAQLTDNLRRYLFSVGKVIKKFNSDWMYEPSILFQYREGIQQSTIDLNAKVYYHLNSSLLYGGVSVRRGLNRAKFLRTNQTITLEQLNYITPFFGIRHNKLHFAYTFTKQVNADIFIQNGQHQITIGYDFSCRKKRHSCNCPAVN